MPFSFEWICRNDSVFYSIQSVKILENINYSGNIDYSSDYDKFKYQDINSTQPTSRPIDIHRFNLNFKFNYKSFNKYIIK